MSNLIEKVQKFLWNIFYWNKPVKLAKKMGVVVGERCRFMRGNKWGSEPYLIEIGNHVLISGGCCFVTHDGCVNTVRGITGNDNLQKFGRILIKDNVSIGTNCIILPGVVIGNNAIVGAGSLINKSIPDGEVWAGVPARFIETTESYAEKIQNNMADINFDEYKKNKRKEIERVIERLS